jgi:hypothetical protein
VDSQQSRKIDFSDAYLEARREVDELCRKIVLGVVTPERAMESYDQIEDLYAKREPSNLEFFRMIYRSRVDRLIDQFIKRNEE